MNKPGNKAEAYGVAGPREAPRRSRSEGTSPISPGRAFRSGTRRGGGERRRFPDLKERLGGTKCLAGVHVPILPLTLRSLGLEKLEMATQELRFVCVPHRCEQELGEAGCLPVGGVV